MLRFFQITRRSLNSLLNLITDLVADGRLFFRLLLRSRTSLSAEVLYLRKQLAFYEVQPRRLNDSARFWWPRLSENIRKLIVQMAQENPTWGQARVAAELSVKLRIPKPPTPNNILFGTMLLFARVVAFPFDTSEQEQRPSPWK